MEKNNYILNVINEIKEVLEKNDYRKKRYDNDVEWFENRGEQIASNIIRIAIMGITSSGKSTLVNALLGEKILPVAIKPSSSIIITCSKGENRQAIIYFRDKKPEILTGDKLNDKIIGEYADESRNPNNQFKVTQIDIKAPSFLLGDNIHIIDSPGLDACDLEMHEKLTLEILLPTIDICIFLTTVKANSDEINVEKIRTVNEKDKQIVLVQNMIDSVEEKLGKNGIIEEDKDTILKKHKKRAENLLKSGTNNKEGFEVIQISALNALKGVTGKNKKLYNKSNIECFIKTIEMCVKKVMPKINEQSEISLRERIDNIITTDKEILDEKNLEYINSLMNVSNGDIDDLVYDFEISKDKISSEIKAINKSITDTINDIKSSSSEEVESYLSIIEKINNKNLKMENEILSIVKECEDKKNDVYRKLNLDIRFNYLLPSMESKNIDVKHKYEERKRLVEKDGVLNKGKRFLSHIFHEEWGYKQEEYDEQVVDKDATIAMVTNVCNPNIGKYINILWDWSTQYNKSLNIFYDEVTKRAEEYEKKKKQNIETYDIEEVIKNLKSIKSKIRKLRPKKQNEVAVTLNDDKKETIKVSNCSISNVQYNVYKLSNEILERNYLLVGKYIKEKSIKKIKKETEHIFWTWDIEYCITFVSRVCGIYLGKNECEVIKKQGIYVVNNVTIIYDLCENKLDFYTALKRIKEKPYNMFVIFNGIQIGNSEKQILESMSLNYFITNNVMLNLVVDSSKEFINANNIKELLLGVSSLEQKIIKKFNNAKQGYVLINSKNPIYNMALIEGQENDEFIISEYKDVKERLFENLLSRGAEQKETIEEILSYFLNKAH
ncbi:dynamin family protein [Clostridium uliginosum]|uniref:Dynamin family protein n=1 Tax=Clostridium uliginosum TaxID=119641 RepID=A0A1I1QDK5_9CLOT|nr:dynamin family protein [Clostridium uliginosum]SFD17313.1 Dynamin family protein [Clostridium uliginosum]